MLSSTRRGRLLVALVVVAGVCCSMLPRAVAQQAAPAAKSSQAALRQYRDAVAFQNRQVYDLAADEWEGFLKQFPQDPLALKARHYMGVCKLQLKKYDEALAAFEAVIKADPKFELLEETYLDLGLTQYSMAQAGKADLFDKAAETFNTLATKFPSGKETGKALYYRGESLYSRGQKEEAAKAYAAALAKEPADGALRPDEIYALGVAQQELGRMDEAGATFDQFLKEFEKNPLRAEVIMRRAETMFAAKKFADAEKWFASAAAAKDFAQADLATMRQGASLYEQKKYAEAAALYAAVPQKFPDSSSAAAAALAAGNCYYLAGNLGDAENWLGKALAAGGESAPEAAHWLARAYLKQKKPDTALAAIDKALPQAGQSPFAANLLLDKADSLYEIPAKRGESVALYAEVAKTHPQHAVAPQALYMAGFAALGQGDYAAAAERAAAFLETYPQDPLLPDVKYIAAEAALLLNQYDNAEKLYAELLTASPTHADVDAWKVRRGLALFLQKKYAEVVQVLEPVAGKLKSPALVAEAQYLLGSSYFELKQYEPASKALQASLTADAKWRQADDTLLALAAVERQTNKLNEALASVRKMLAEFPNSKLLDRAHFRLGEYAYAANDFKSAAAEYQQVITNWPTSSLAPHAEYGLGWSQLAAKEYQQAADNLTKLIDKRTDHALVPRARYARAMARQQLKQFDGAIEDIQAFLKSNPSAGEKSDARYVEGLCDVGLKKNGQAIEVFRAILKDDPQYSATDKVLYELAWALKSENKEAEAAEAFGNLAKQKADSPLAPESLYHLGEFNYQNKDYGKAAEAYFAAEQKAGSSDLGEKAAYKLAWSYYQQGQFGKAQQGFDYQAAKFAQGELAADALFMAAESLFKQNKYEAAAAAYEKTLARPPQNKDFQALALLHAGQVQGQLKKWEESLKLLGKAAKQFPESPYLAELLYEQGWAQQNLGQSDAAFKLFEQANDANNGEIGARAQFMMGEIFFEKKDYKEAVRRFFKVAYGYGGAQAPEAVQKWQANSTYEAARCFEMLKMTEQARKSYTELVEKFPKSDKLPLAQTRLKALGN